MTVATALAVSWKPLTNSKPSAISSARPSKREDAERQRLMHALDVVQQAMHAITDARRQKAEEDDGPYRAGLVVELGRAAPVICFGLNCDVCHFLPRAKISGIRGVRCDALMKPSRNDTASRILRRGVNFVQSGAS